jgi:hypothetical protein
MTADATSPAPLPDSTMCARHPDVETGLACGRCGTPICPRCLVYTPAGTRCPDCATIGRPKMYTLGALDYVRAIATAVVVGIAIGFVAALLFAPSPRVGLFSFIFAVAGGYGLGTAMAEALNLTTSRKRGRQMQIIAGGGVVLAALTRLVVSGVPSEYVVRDISGLMLVAIAVSVASSRLR